MGDILPVDLQNLESLALNDIWRADPVLAVVQEDEVGPSRFMISNQPHRRLNTLQGGNHRRLNIRYAIAGDRERLKDIHYRASQKLAQHGVYRLGANWFPTTIEAVVETVIKAVKESYDG